MEENQPLLTMAERNVVILGQVGAGKRTLGNHIVGENIFQNESAISSGKANSHYRELWTGDTLYRILTVDTGGMQTGYCNPLPYIRDRFQKIHLILLVVANGRYTDESHRSLMRVVQSLQEQAKLFTALVITHCEGITDEQRRSIVAEFQNDHQSSQVAAFIGKEICTIGLPNLSKVSPTLKPIYENGIAEDEKAIRRLVKECHYSINVQDLPAIQSNCFRHCWESVCALWEHCRCSKCLLVVFSICCFPIVLIYACYSSS